MRSIWKGHIRFSLVTIPVRIYNAIETSESIRFNQLHKDCNGPVGYEKKCKKCAKVVPTDEILKGYQYEPDQYVIMDPADFEKVRLKSTKVIEIEGFVNASEVPQAWYDAPYFAGPDGDVAAGTYALLSLALKQSKKVGIGKVVLRDREDVVLVAPEDNGIILYKLRYPDELRKMDRVPQLDKVPASTSPEQLKLAQQLIDSMSKKLFKIELKDKYSSALREIIDAKIQGKEVVSFAEEEIPVVDIMTALKESIAQAKAGGGMVVAEGEKAKAAAGKGKKPAKAEKAKPKAKRKAG